MTAMLTDFSDSIAVAARSRAESYIADHRFERPTLVIDTEARRALSERLSFNPWHALRAHRPLGGINRLRFVRPFLLDRFAGLFRLFLFVALFRLDFRREFIIALKRGVLIFAHFLPLWLFAHVLGLLESGL